MEEFKFYFDVGDNDENFLLLNEIRSGSAFKDPSKTNSNFIK